MTQYRTARKRTSIRQRLVQVLLRDLGLAVDTPYRTNMKCWRISQGAPSWLVTTDQRTIGSRYTMTECVRLGVRWTDETEGNFVRLIEPKPPT